MAARSPDFAPATKADLEALPPNVKGEIIDGVLHTQPRPRSRHQWVISRLDGRLGSSYGFGDDPGGWWILPEPGIELPRAPEISPDVAGWRRERLPELPDEAITVVPDWVCEVLSPRTRAYDLKVKKPFYAQVGVRWCWYIDFTERALTVSRLHEGRWLELAVHGDDDRVRVEPFEDVELNLAEWWL
jgi:Uma2 family endonuclease